MTLQEKALEDLVLYAHCFWAWAKAQSSVGYTDFDGNHYENTEGLARAAETLKDINDAVAILTPLVKSNQKATLQARIIYILSDGTPRATRDILHAIPDANPVAVKKAIRKVVEAGEIIKVKHGVYQRIQSK